MPSVISGDANVSATEFGFLDGVTSGLQSQINAKANDSAVGLVKIADATFTAQTSVSVNNCFTSAYEHYRIMVDAVASATEADMTLRLRLSGTDATGSNYTFFQQASGVNSTAYNQASTGATSATIGRVGTNGTSSFSLDVFRPAQAVRTTWHTQNIGQGTTTDFVQSGGGRHGLSTAYDGLTIAIGGGLTMTGTIRVYGYRN